MSADVTLVIVLVAFFAMVLIEVPIGIATALAGITGLVLLESWDIAARVIAPTPYSASAKYALFVIPMYILLGTLVANVGIGAQIYSAVNRMVGWLPGGLAAAAVLATAVFSGISGSSAADVATFGRISVTEMTKHGYDSRYASAVVAAAGTFAVLIPPSIILVIYGIVAEESIGALILAGVIPGILSALALALFVVVRGVIDRRQLRRPSSPVVVSDAATPTGTADPPVAEVELADGSTLAASAGHAQLAASTSDFKVLGFSIQDIKGLALAALLFGIVLGGLYSGTFTATEAGAIGAFVASIIAVIMKPPPGSSRRSIFASSLRECADVTSMIFLLLIGGAIFAYYLVYAGFPTRVAEWAVDLDVEPKILVAIFLLILVVLGMFLDGLSIMLIAVPIAAPVVTELGFDGVWFGILVVKMIEIGLITPPVGINVFIIAGVMEQPVEEIFRKVAPFVVLDLVVTSVFFVFPDIVLWLPRQAGLV